MKNLLIFLFYKSLIKFENIKMFFLKGRINALNQQNKDLKKRWNKR